MSRFFDTDNWREIGATLSRNKTRTFLTAFGIFWGTAMLALLLGGASGLRGMLMRNFAGMSTNMVAMFTQPTTISYKGYNKGSSWELTDRDIEAFRSRIPEIEYISGIVSVGGNISYMDKSKTASMVGSNADYFKIAVPVLQSGRLITERDFQRGEKVAVIGKNLAATLFGTENPIGKYVNAGGAYVQIIGVASQQSEASLGANLDDALVMPFTTLRRMWGLGDYVHYVAATLYSGKHLADIKPTIQRVISATHPISPDDEQAVAYMDIAEMFEQVQGVFLAVSLLAFFVGAGTLIAGIIGVGNIMWIIVKERTTEIGIRRAIGARPSNIIFMILSEGIALTTIAGLAGISFATIILGFIDHLLGDPVKGSPGFEMSFTMGVAILLTFMILGSLAGLIPSIKAMKIKPIEAINDK